MNARRNHERALAVFFDAVGTVLIPQPGVAVVYSAAAVQFGIAGSAAGIVERFRQAIARQEHEDALAGWVTDEAREVRRWREIVQDTLPCAPDACFDWLYQHFARPESWRVPCSVPPLLQNLQESGIRLGIASNFDSRLETVLAGRPELTPVTGHVVISSRVGVRKPSAKFFEQLAIRAQCRPDEIVLIGDDLVNDYQGATNAGLQAILYDPDNRHPEVDQRVTSLADLAGVL